MCGSWVEKNWFVCVIHEPYPTLRHDINVRSLAQAIMEATGTNRIGHAVGAVMRAREARGSTALPSVLQMVINVKEDGRVHKLRETTLKLPRDRRRWLASGICWRQCTLFQHERMAAVRSL